MCVCPKKEFINVFETIFLLIVRRCFYELGQGWDNLKSHASLKNFPAFNVSFPHFILKAFRGFSVANCYNGKFVFGRKTTIYEDTWHTIHATYIENISKLYANEKLSKKVSSACK